MRETNSNRQGTVLGGLILAGFAVTRSCCSFVYAGFVGRRADC
jgi:hypothetical protein